MKRLTINEDIKEAISDSHKETLDLVADARKSIAAAMPADQVKTYQSIDRNAGKRDICHDKVMLQKAGVIDQAAATKRMTRPRVTKSMVRSVAKAATTIEESFHARPVASMSDSERDQYKMMIAPIGRLYVDLSTS